MIQPSCTRERSLWKQGYQIVVGLDEAGRGSWAGPVVAGAVVLPAQHPNLMTALDGVRDSKMLSPKRRGALLVTIESTALASAAGFVPAEVIDEIGIVPATRRAMQAALAQLGFDPEYLLIDALRLPTVNLPQYVINKGDAKILSIAAASIVAKVYRDRWMIEQDKVYAGYGFAAHKGYGTAQHRQALDKLGPCTLHRYSFAPLRQRLLLQDS